MERKEEIIVNGYAYPSISASALMSWMGDLTFVTAFSYGFTPEGNLIQLDDDKIIRAARTGGVEPLMALTPFDESGRVNSYITRQMLENPESQKRLIDNLLINLEEKGLFGVDFNFEFIDPRNKESYTNFITEAAIRLNGKGYLATVALPPKKSAIDYEGIGQAANLVLLLTFERGNGLREPIAISPADIRGALGHAMETIPPAKILIGIPNCGYYFSRPFDDGIEGKLALVSEYGLAGVSFWTIMRPFPKATGMLNSMYAVKKIERDGEATE